MTNHKKYLLVFVFISLNSCGDSALVGTTAGETVLPATVDTLQTMHFSVAAEKSVFNTGTVKFAVTGSAPGILAGVNKVLFSHDLCGTGSLQDYDGSAVEWTVPAEAHNTSFRVSLQFQIGESVSSCFDTGVDLTHDATAPTLTAIANVNDATSTTYVVTITSPEKNSQIAVFATACDTEFTWIDAAESVAVELAAGLSSIHIVYRDEAGNQDQCRELKTDGSSGDGTAPTLTASIDSAAAYSTTGSMTLTLTSDTAIAQYQLSATSDCSSPGDWVVATTPATTINVTVTKTPFTEGETYNASAKIRNSGGTESACATDSILLDGTAPSATIAIAGGADSTSSGSVSVTNTVTGTASQMNVSTTASCGGTWVDYAATATVTISGLGTQTVYGQFRDAAGNTSSCVSDTITVISGGGIDTSFGTNGTASFGISGTLRQVIRQGTTDYIVAVDTGSSVRISRIDSTGTLDSSFTHTISDNAPGTGTALTIDSSNKVHFSSEVGDLVRIHKLTDTGSLDASWGSSGTSSGLATTADTATIVHSAADTSNNIWAFGIGSNQFAFVVANSSGTATAQTNINTNCDTPGGMVVDSTNTLGYGLMYTSANICVMGVTTSGANGSWNGSSEYGSSNFLDAGAPQITIQSDGLPIVAAVKSSALALLRLTAAGAPDTSYDGGDGIVTLGSSVSALRTLYIDASNTIYACYQRSSVDYCATITSSGTVSATFFTAPSGFAIGKFLADSSGNFYVAGDGTSGIDLIRMSSTGATDSSFSHTEGTLTGTFMDAHLLSDGSIVLVNTSGSAIKVQ